MHFISRDVHAYNLRACLNNVYAACIDINEVPGLFNFKTMHFLFRMNTVIVLENPLRGLVNRIFSIIKNWTRYIGFLPF